MVEVEVGFEAVFEVVFEVGVVAESGVGFAVGSGSGFGSVGAEERKPVKTLEQELLVALDVLEDGTTDDALLA